MKKIAIILILVAGIAGFMRSSWQGWGTVLAERPATPAPSRFHENFRAALQELRIEELRLGEGTSVVDGNRVSLHYRQTLRDGKGVDSTYDRKEPLNLTLGRAEALPGLERGLLGMKPGGKRRIHVPAFLGYGDKPVGDLVPAGSDLVYEVELLKIESAKKGESRTVAKAPVPKGLALASVKKKTRR